MDDIVTGTDFISTRQRVNESYGSFDYDSWVMNVIKPEQGDDALDLGCGTGKHARTLSRLVGTGTVVGVDKSPKSVAVARSLCGTEKLYNVQIVACGVDMVPRLLDDRKFDIILASYSIYYSADQVSLMRRLAHLLEPFGRLFVTGNDKGNNRELVNFINNLSPAIPAPVYRPFVTAREIECAGSSYRCYTVYHKTNKVAFPSCMEITEYWRASS
ncbi:class I SAM-dependent methyltransferase, partial [Candidatus Magnetobacterium casense]